MEPDVLMDSPEGSPVALKVYGAVPPVAVMVALYAPPAVPLERLEVVMLSGVDCAGGLPELPDLSTTVPQPARNSAAKKTSIRFGVCIVTILLQSLSRR